ncbi:unnamed protein product [Kuraishia capsulata CBS 1993]|uniref:MPN domain-containing protein n=1 Tax=Kuraishia capsulata CBS 1993 TaxID=1382522 RepID=W6MKC6_9ASCO|nr:uncharacterized protein KUCA_T00002775001 [Kuraishia capsulata CBS 1993]CDK26801.1 unnamed protein product [Kuraishia capsulata CBS 1993]
MSTPVLHIVRPNQAAPAGSSAAAPLKVSIQASALLQLVESSYHEETTRTTGALLGIRSDDGSEIEVVDSYIVPHQQVGENLTIEGGHHISQYVLSKRTNPDLALLGWFSTSHELDAYTGLFHDFYSRGSSISVHPHPAIHLTIQTRDSENNIIAPKLISYVASPVGASGALAAHLNIEKVGSYAFTPVPNKVVYSTAEKTALSWIKEPTKLALPTGNAVELVTLSQELGSLSGLVDRVLAYTDKVISGEIQGDEKLGRELLSQLSAKPTSVSADALEKLFNHHTQDSLLVEYLASSIRTQLELSAKLTSIVQSEI